MSTYNGYQYHASCSTYYSCEVRVRRGLLLCLTFWITEWRDSDGTGAIHSQPQPLDCNCHISGTPLFNIVHQLWAWGLYSSVQLGSECHFIRVWSNVFTIILEKHRKYMNIHWLGKDVYVFGGLACPCKYIVASKTGRLYTCFRTHISEMLVKIKSHCLVYSI